jgi:site-specific DNA-cytosine methylase
MCAKTPASLLMPTEREEYPWRRALMKPKWIKLCHVGLGSDSRYTLVRSDWDLPAPTLTASGQQPDGRCGVLHPAEHRKFSIPELKRLFGLPDDYVFTGSLADAAEPLGNMVPPFLTRALAERVYELVLRPYAEKRR